MLPKRIGTLALSMVFFFVGQGVVDSAPDLEIQTIKSGANVVVDQVVEEGSKVIFAVSDAPEVNFFETKELLAQKQGYRVHEKYPLIPNS